MLKEYIEAANEHEKTFQEQLKNYVPLQIYSDNAGRINKKLTAH